ncbi:MAG: glycerophosphodiester phosphodiesterase [Deltaproteobacteria bacterium]|nr:glycerophosphodiester phosphodiesterase [Deltaproteobacteria bacterium]MBW2720507.1 glycerophosphodiester phosphodiesterase [Deltaproteobacteria bacterium]
MNKLFLVLTIVSIAVTGCGSSSNGTGGTGGQAGSGGSGGSGGMGGEGGTGGAEPKCQTPQEMIRCDKVLNIAHRGGRRVRPEHTLLAYDQALEDGTDILEMDVHETVDGMLVVMHDRTVDRTTNCTGAIKEMTFADLRECDAGYNFTSDDGATYPYRDMGLVVPTMVEVFERYPDTAFVIEIKQGDPSIVDHFVEVIREHGVEDKMIGATFSAEVLDELRAAAPEIPTSMEQTEVLTFWGKAYQPIDPEYEPPGEFLQVPVEQGGINVLHENFVPRAHELGMFVHMWTINDEEEMRYLIETHGVDGIMTDDPPLLTKVINELGVGD